MNYFFSLQKEEMAPRSLTPEEIEQIIDFITPNKCIPPAIAKNVVEYFKSRLRFQLKSIKIYSSMIPEIKKLIIQQYYSSMSIPGTLEGINMAQNIGESHTQSCLNTFHKAGSSEKPVNKNRFSELINASKKVKNASCFIYFINNNTDIHSLRTTIGNSLVELKLKDFIIDVEKFTEPPEEKWMDAYSALYGDEWEKNSYVAGIKIKVKTDLLYEYNLTFDDIKERLSMIYDDVEIIFSPEQIGEIIIFVSTEELQPPPPTHPKAAYINETNYVDIHLEEVIKPKLFSTHMFGIPKITNMFFLKKSGEWYVETEGNNFIDILCMNNVDTKKTISTNIWDIYETLGIEAAKQYMCDEFEAIMPNINSCHSQLLVSRMTFFGTIEAVTRHTMQKGDLWRDASFEETVKQFLEASLTGRDNPTTSVSGSIVCGNKPNIGTNIMRLKAVIDE